MLKTFLVLMVATVMSFSIMGCGGGEKPAPPAEKPAQESVTPAEGSEAMEGSGTMEEGEEHPTPMTEEEGSGTQ